MSSPHRIAALDDLRCNLPFFRQMICKQYIVLTYFSTVFFYQTGDAIEEVEEELLSDDDEYNGVSSLHNNSLGLLLSGKKHYKQYNPPSTVTVLCGQNWRRAPLMPIIFTILLGGHLLCTAKNLY